MLVPKKFIYCWWLALWGLLYYVDIITISPLFSWIIAATFTTIVIIFLNKSKRFSITLKIILVAVECLILYLVYTKKSHITQKDLMWNIVGFIIYFLFLHHNNLDFYKVYFKMLPSTYKDITASSYIQTRLKEFGTV